MSEFAFVERNRHWMEPLLLCIIFVLMILIALKTLKVI